MLTAVTVIGVGRLIVQRQNYENSIERSYQREIAARVQLAEGVRPAVARATIRREEANRAQLRESISGDTRDTVILVGAGLIAGLLGALLLFVGLITAMRRPLEALVAAAGRLAGGDRSARVKVGGVSEVATLGTAFNEMAAELELEASERDRLDRMKDEFVLTASHELRSPLTSVQGFAELLMMDRDSLTPRQVETVEIILDNCRHLVRLLNDLLDLARSDAGRLSIRPQPTAPGPLVEDVVRTMRAQTAATDQTLTQRIDPNLPLVNVEPDRIRQILVNLVTNAHDYSPERASIQVRARVADNGVEISVIDDGPGIPPSQLDHIFERFVRGDAGLTQRVGGTGLGLAISKSLVELHGGTITATSEAGRGSTFTVTLPVAGPEALQAPPVGTPVLGEGGRR
ncbi:MAG: HAMP domain-containing histidine kinase [Actinobacteria bacterium]|nr:HAMP domain-containing histidine kinase [Actinomycetota bacterium]